MWCLASWLTWWSEQMRMRIIAVLLLALGLAACGFRLQGTGGYPDSMATTYISAEDRYTPFYLKLVDSLERGGINVSSSPIDAGAVIQIEKDSTEAKVLTISKRKVPTELDVIYKVRYSLWIEDKEAIPSRSLSRQQDFTYDPDEVLGKKREEENVRNAMAESLVQQVNRELSIIK